MPEYAASSYPVESTYAQANNSCHLSRNATKVFSTIMVTYGNGELCSKPLCNSINRDCIQRLKVYCSSAKQKNQTNTPNCPPKDGTFIKCFPPLGASMRDMCDAASSCQKNAWCLSDHDRHIREIQAAKTDSIFCQDHTFQVTKNYKKGKGLPPKAVWDVATGTGEIASAVLVPSTQTKDFAHAAQQLLKRPHFNPKVKHSDTWPHKIEHWSALCPGTQGRLGLFHCQQRIISTMRKKHVDCSVAVTDLLASLHACFPEDYEQLLTALKNGTLSRNGKRCSSEEISDMKRSSQFRDRYAKYLRKTLHQPETICQMLDDWFCRYKVTSSDPVNRPAGGRLDPDRLQPLFTIDTKLAIDNCKKKACCLSDPLPIEEMYQPMYPNPNSTHQLTECLSLRGESKLEAFHDRFAHFANCGVRNSLADNLNLAGTARYNLAIRHKRSLVLRENPKVLNEKLVSEQQEQRKKMPAGWEDVAPFFNHTELSHVNAMAKDVGCSQLPFQNAEQLPEDNGERFFSEHMTTTMPSLKGTKHGEFDQCLCALCSKTSTKNVVFAVASPTKKKAQTINNTNNNETPPAMRPSTNNNVNSNIARQQASQPKPPPIWNIANTLKTTIHTATLGAPFTPIAPALIPMQFQIPHYVQPQMMPCCDKCARWLTIRKGRPPHHPLCSQRYSST